MDFINNCEFELCNDFQEFDEIFENTEIMDFVDFDGEEFSQEMDLYTQVVEEFLDLIYQMPLANE